MRISRDEAKLLGRRAAQPIKAPDEILAIFVAGKLKNPLNAGWAAAKWEHGYRQRWREAVALALLEAGYGWKRSPALNTLRAGLIAKRVAFHAHVHQKFDSDGLQAALKPVRDALVDCGMISGDAERDGHSFSYAQTINRAQRGVTIRIALRSPHD